MRRTVKPTPTNILNAEKLLDHELEYDSGSIQGANTQKELEEEIAEDTIDKLEEEMDIFLDDTWKDQWGKA